MPVATGRLNRRYALQAETRTPNGSGGFARAWVTQRTVWARAVPTTGGERQTADRTEARSGWTVTIRQGGAVPTPAMRLVDQRTNAVLRITNVDDADGRRAEWTLTCEEVA